VDEAGGEDILFLKGRAPYHCRYRLSFGPREICCCPTRYGIWKYYPQNEGRDHQVGFWMADKKDIIFNTNRCMENIFGVSRDQIVGASVRTDLPAGAIGPLTLFYDRAIETGKAVRYEKVPVVTPAGRQSLQSGWMIPRLKDQDLPRIICIIEDGIRQKGGGRRMNER
jgi:PAS domain S-box-containing protein